MSTIQKEIEGAELLAAKELDVAVQYLAKKRVQAEKKARDIVSSAQKDSDLSFLSKREILEKKLVDMKVQASSSLSDKIKKLDSKRGVLIGKGVSFLLARISK